MTRGSPAAWRRLMAAGGAPAAAHAVLARAPAPARLLDPLAGVRLVDETSLAALTRPLDVAGVLARVLDATQGEAVSAPLDPDGVRRAAGAIRSPGSDDGRVARVRPASSVRSELDASEPNSDGPTVAGSHIRPPRPGASRSAAGREAGDVRPPWPSAPRPAAVRQAARPRRDALGERRADGPPSLPATNGYEARAGWRRRPMGTEATIGAGTRVVFEAPHADVERLLARAAERVSDPTPPTRRSVADVPRPDPSPTERATPDADAAHLLVRAVERVSGRARPASTASGFVAPRSPGRGRTITPLETEPRRGEAPSPVAEGGIASGGFRGLALRTLGASGEPRHLPVRLEREAPAREISLDDLDARVTESLARILEREARRHGIDVGAGA